MRPTMRINYSYVMSQVRAIGNLSNDLKNEAIKLQQEMNMISKLWNGEAAIEFINGCKTLRTNMDNTSKKISSLASKISRVAADIQREDEMAIERYEREMARNRYNKGNKP